MTITTPPTLTADDLRVMRKVGATSIDGSLVFRFDASEYGYSRIECNQRNTGEIEGRQTVIPVAPTSVTNYERPTGGTATGCWIASSGPTLTTMLRVAKAGDTLWPIWTVNNNSDKMRENGICRDELQVRLARPGRSRQSEYVFLLDVWVGQVDDRWRNVKYKGL